MEKLKKFGISGALIAGFLCLTPFLAIAFGAFGLSWILGYLDFFLIPLLLLFLAITVYAYFHGRRKLDVQ